MLDILRHVMAAEGKHGELVAPEFSNAIFGRGNPFGAILAAR